jgi:hypothetical protein
VFRTQLELKLAINAFKLKLTKALAAVAIRRIQMVPSEIDNDKLK